MELHEPQCTNMTEGNAECPKPANGMFGNRLPWHCGGRNSAWMGVGWCILYTALLDLWVVNTNLNLTWETKMMIYFGSYILQYEPVLVSRVAI